MKSLSTNRIILFPTGDDWSWRNSRYDGLYGQTVTNWRRSFLWKWLYKLFTHSNGKLSALIPPHIFRYFIWKLHSKLLGALFLHLLFSDSLLHQYFEVVCTLLHGHGADCPKVLHKSCSVAVTAPAVWILCLKLNVKHSYVYFIYKYDLLIVLWPLRIDLIETCKKSDIRVRLLFSAPHQVAVWIVRWGSRSIDGQIYRWMPHRMATLPGQNAQPKQARHLPTTRSKCVVS